MVALPLLLALAGWGIKALTDQNVLYLNLFACLLVYLIDATRKDTRFIFLLKREGALLRIAEYSIVILMLNIYALSLSAANLLYITADILFVLLVINFSTANKKPGLPYIARALTSYLPTRMYELKFGLRQLLMLMLPLWLLSLITSFFGPGLPFAIIIIPLMLLDHISYAEPHEITQSHITITNALGKKMLQLALAVILCFLPQFIITLCLWYSPALLGAIAGALWVTYATMYYALLMRYSENSRSAVSKSFLVLLFLVTTILPPVSIFILYKQYKSVKCNLQPLLA